MTDPTRFDVDVAPGGYVWWYLDALSDDGTEGLTVIAFLGSVFSPYYAHARHRRGSAKADPIDHCAINVALYGRGGNRWSMTERRAAAVKRSATRLQIGPSSLAWRGDTLTLHLDEIAAPLPYKLRGTITLRTGARPVHRVPLDAQARHHWGVIAPSARVDVVFDTPRRSWSGPAYLDSNRGCVPLEDDFTRWDWSRGHLADGRTAVIYDIERRQGGRLAIADWFDAAGHHGPFEPPPVAALPRTGWGLSRTTRAESPAMPTIALPLEDGPFYARSVVQTRWLGQPVTSVHEHLSLRRFESRWVRALLPFRMPRRMR